MHSLAKFPGGNGLRGKHFNHSVRQISKCGVVLVLKSGCYNGVLARSKQGGTGRVRDKQEDRGRSEKTLTPS